MIHHGRHAVSIDERRCFYQDNLWGKPVPVEGTTNVQDLRQVWFAGVHSDVGGSYPQLLSGLANITLKWMIDETRAAGALSDATNPGGDVFDEARVRMVLGSPAAGEPTRDLATLSTLYEKPKASPLHRSLCGIWWLLEFLPHRYYDKDDSSVKKRIPLGAYRVIPQDALVHPSVKQRLQTDPCFRPKNVTSEELVAAADDYLRFQPTVCRSYAVRGNWLVVFLVSVLELGLLLAALWRLAVLVGRTGPLLAMMWRWVRRAAPEAENYVMSRWFEKPGLLRDSLWLLLLATVLVVATRLVSLARRPER